MSELLLTGLKEGLSVSDELTVTEVLYVSESEAPGVLEGLLENSFVEGLRVTEIVSVSLIKEMLQVSVSELLLDELWMIEDVKLFLSLELCEELVVSDVLEEEMSLGEVLIVSEALEEELPVSEGLPVLLEEELPVSEELPVLLTAGLSVSDVVELPVSEELRVLLAIALGVSEEVELPVSEELPV